MEAGPGGGAGARDGTRVVGDLRLDQYDIEHFLSSFPRRLLREKHYLSL